MRALLLWADGRSTNLGVRALQDGTEALLRQVWSDVSCDVQSFGPGPAPMRVGSPRALVRERLTGRAGLLAWLRTYDLVIDTRAGDSFTDSYGRRRLLTMTLLAELAAEAGVPVVMGPQTIGPFGTLRGRAAARHSLRRARLVMARDSVSADEAARLGRPVDVLTTDVVFALPTPDVARTRDVVLNVSGLLWHDNPHVDAGAYRRTMADLHRSLVASGREVSLLAHVLASGTPDDDIPAVQELSRTVAPDAEILVPSSLTEVREMVASARLVVGSRMHACLNALSVGTPAVPLAYSRKFAPLLGDLGWTATVDLRTQSAPVGAVARLAARDDLDDLAGRARAHARHLLRPAEDALRGLTR